MDRDEALAAELRNATGRMARLFRSVRRGEADAVDRLDEIMHDVDRVAARLDPKQRPIRATPAPETRFTTGPIRLHGRVIPVETRRRSAECGGSR